MTEHAHDHASENALEQSLEDALEGRISKDEFLRVFLTSNLFILLDGAPEGDTLGVRKPMVFAHGEGEERLLAVFSSPERCETMKERFSEYHFPVMVSCEWVFQALGPSTGIALNPGCEYGFELAAEGANQLKAAIKAITPD